MCVYSPRTHGSTKQGSRCGHLPFQAAERKLSQQVCTKQVCQYPPSALPSPLNHPPTHLPNPCFCLSCPFSIAGAVGQHTPWSMPTLSLSSTHPTNPSFCLSCPFYFIAGAHTPCQPLPSLTCPTNPCRSLSRPFQAQWVNLGTGIEMRYLPGSPLEPSAYDSTFTSDPAMFPQLWCPNGTYSAYGVLFFKPIDQVLSTLVHFRVRDWWGGGRVRAMSR